MKIRYPLLILLMWISGLQRAVAQNAMLPVEENNLYGFKRNDEFIIKPQFNYARRFFEGLAAVEKGNKWGYIDSTGNLKIPCIFFSAADFSEGLAKIADSQNVQNYINYQGIRQIKGVFFQGRDFKSGLAPIRVVSEWFYIDATGKPVINKSFFDAGDFSESVAPVRMDNGAMGFIDRQGNVAIPANLISAQRFSSGLAAVQKKDSHGKIYSCFIRHNGSLAFERFFENAGYFSEGLAPARSQTNHLWGYVDTLGNWKITPMFAKAGEFSSGVAEIEDNAIGLATYIDNKGKLICRKTDVPSAAFGGLPDVYVNITADPNIGPEVYFVPYSTYAHDTAIMLSSRRDFCKATKPPPLRHYQIHQYSYYLYAIWPDGIISKKFFNSTTQRDVQISKKDL